MKLDGIHHVTCITADAPRNVDFYTRVLGLRMVKKTVNQDDPTVYHLFYADERGSAGSDITFFEYPGARAGRAGRGMVSSIVWRVGSQQALDFWEQRLGDEGAAATRSDGGLRFDDPEGLGLELELFTGADAPLVAEHPDIPHELALQGFGGVRMYSSDTGARARAAGADARLRAATATPAGRCRASTAERSTSGCPLPTSRASPAPERCTTWPGRRAWPSTRTGSGRWRPTATTPRR